MTPCLSDRMPEVALGRSEWNTDEREHLDGCADCLAEWELVQAASRLGSPRPYAGNPEAITAAVLGRLARERVSAQARRRTWLVTGLAAAAVTIIAVRIPRPPAGTSATTPAVSTVPSPSADTSPRPGRSPLPAPISPALPLPELDDLPASTLESILGALDESDGVSAQPDESGLDDFDDHELDRALSAWEG